MIEIALYQPDIAQNAATSVRLAACLGVTIHIIEPAGFVWNTRDFRRAGMDYIDQADIVRQPDWETFLAEMSPRRIVLATTHAETAYTAFGFQADDILLVGRESAGVPDHVRDSVAHQISIPMQPGTRSLNVAVATAMITGEALRQTVWQAG
ncbi:MAG: tRNA (cytidine(34)-2'-O)-methyltransferase [Anderseniella sp.]|nr:tRNA (cytidine(34)-2'-O)-methyltransferase [Anderseniella sp.]